MSNDTSTDYISQNHYILYSEYKNTQLWAPCASKATAMRQNSKHDLRLPDYPLSPCI